MTSPISDYTRLANTLEALSRAAEQGDWEQMGTLQVQQEQLLDAIRQRPKTPRDRAETAALIKLMERALASIRAAQPHIDSLKQHTESEMAGTNNHRKLSQSYR